MDSVLEQLENEAIKTRFALLNAKGDKKILDAKTAFKEANDKLQYYKRYGKLPSSINIVSEYEYDIEMEAEAVKDLPNSNIRKMIWQCESLLEQYGRATNPMLRLQIGERYATHANNYNVITGVQAYEENILKINLVK